MSCYAAHPRLPGGPKPADSIMNVGTLKTLSYLSSFGLLGGIGYIGYDYVENGRNASYFDIKRAGKVLNNVSAPKAQKPVALDYEGDVRPAIVDFDWTAAPPPPPPEIVETGPEDTEPVVVPIADILDVMLAMSDPEDPSDSLCLLRFIDSSIEPKEQYMVVGSVLPSPHENVSVFRITPEGVEFSFADEDRESEFVTPGMRSNDGIITRVGEGESAQKRNINGVVKKGQIAGVTPAPAQTEKRNGQFYIGSEDADLFSTNYQEIFSKDVKTKTHYDENGKRAGVEITEVRAGSVASRHGAQSGDVVISINGTSVNSEQEAIGFVRNNSDRYDVWEVQVMNLGRVRTEVYHSPEN